MTTSRPFASVRAGSTARHSFFLRALVVTAAAGLAVPAQVAVAQTPSTGSIVGTVTAAETSTPLSGVRVSIEGASRSVLTDESGHYRLPGLTEGRYVVTALRLGRTPARDTVQLAPGASVTVNFSLVHGAILLPGVVTTATRGVEAAGHATATVNVLPTEAVRTSPARTVDDLLREMPGLELPRTSSTVSGPEEIVSIRGTDEGRTLVLADGVPLNDPWGEWIEWNRVPRQAVDRVEVVEGGGSSLYGNYAMGGVIHVLTRPIAPRTVIATASGGSRDAADVSLYGSEVRGRLGVSLDGDYGSGGGYELLREDQRGPVDRESEVKRRSVNARAEYALGNASTLSGTVGYFNDDRSLGTLLTEPNSRRIWSGSARGSFGNVGGGRMNVTVFGQDQWYVSHQASVAPDRSVETLALAQTIPSHDIGGSIDWSRPAGPFQRIAVGADVRLMKGRLDEDVFDAGGSFTGKRSSGGSQQIGGLFVQGILAPVNRLRLEMSVRADGWRNNDGSRVDNTSGTPEVTTFDSRTDGALSPRLGARYELGSGVAVRASFYQAFRAPTLSEQFRTFFGGPNVFQGNPELGPEHLTGGDVGIDVTPGSGVEFRLTGFWNQMRDLASFVRVGDAPGGGSLLQRENVGRARSRGIEAELALHPLDALTVAATYNYDDTKVPSTGQRVARVPLNRGSARVTYDAPRLFTGTLIYRYEGTNTTIGGAPLGAFAVVDADVRRELTRDVVAFLGVENLFDRDYAVNLLGPLEFQGLPRTVRGGVRIVVR
ncbi:MAG TPA: TonB-dependent receptor [Gemmatimonadaceae bacterium]|nr:TonB-dependent receptor [Gemmatimonadaceae bacterium]